MKIQNLTYHYISGEHKIQNTIFKSNNVIYDEDYVIIPRQKYNREKTASIIINTILGIDLIYNLYKLFSKKPILP